MDPMCRLFFNETSSWVSESSSCGAMILPDCWTIFQDAWSQQSFKKGPPNYYKWDLSLVIPIYNHG